MKPHHDPPVLVAVNFLTLRAGDHGGLAAGYSWLGVTQGRAKDCFPRRSQERIAVALMKVVRALDLVHGLFKHLRLTAFMANFSQQPQLIPVVVGMFAQGQKMAADQSRLIAVPIAQQVVMAMTFKCPLREMSATVPVREPPRIIVVFKPCAVVASRRSLHGQKRLLEMVITASGTLGASLQP